MRVEDIQFLYIKRLNESPYMLTSRVALYYKDIYSEDISNHKSRIALNMHLITP